MTYGQLLANILFGGAAIAAIAFVTMMVFYIVPQQNAFIIERFGKFHRYALAGFHVKIPLVDRIAKTVELRTQQLTFKIDGKTQDNVTIICEIAAQYRVSNVLDPDPAKTGIYRSFYTLNNPIEQLESYLTDALRSAIPKYSLDDIFDKKDDIGRGVKNTVSSLMSEFGYDVVSTLITRIKLPRDVENAMNSINSAEREKVAAQSLADAERIRTVTAAKAEADAMEQAGIGIANQRKAIANGIKESLGVIKEAGVTTDEANMLFAYTQWVDMMGEFASNGRGSTVVLPADFKQSASTFEQMLVSDKTTGEK